VSALVYDSFLTGFAQRNVDWVQDNFKVVLVSGDYQPDTMAHRTRADLEGFELGTMPGYDRGGNRLRGRTIEQNDPTGVMLAAGDVAFDNFTGDFRYAVVCQDNGNRSQDLLISVADMGDQHVENARVMLAYSTDGVCLFAPEED
jgi:hypothetical protein